MNRNVERRIKKANFSNFSYRVIHISPNCKKSLESKKVSTWSASHFCEFNWNFRWITYKCNVVWEKWLRRWKLNFLNFELLCLLLVILEKKLLELRQRSVFIYFSFKSGDRKPSTEKYWFIVNYFDYIEEFVVSTD